MLRLTCVVHAQAVEAVAKSVRAHGVTNLVVDPVLVATSGDALAADGVARALVTRSARARLRAGARSRVARAQAELGA
jgi:hydroxymethylpyrimidine/phosphomethylpyrimidine kinase